MTYYNEFDRHAAAWLRELGKAGEIEPGEVDERSIADVTADDVRRYTRCHWFAGIGGWDYALRLAGWPTNRPVWTGSCPCQPYSAAGKRKGHKDERDLWPVFYGLIKEARPSVIFGEQVASSDVIGSSVEAAFVDAVQRGDYARANKLAKRVVTQPAFHSHPRWITRVRADLEGVGYAVRWSILGAHSVQAPHIRQRLYWVANATEPRAGEDERQLRGMSGWRCEDGRLAYRESEGRSGMVAERETGIGKRSRVGGGCTVGRLADADVTRPLSSTHRGIHSGEKSTGTRDVELERCGGDCRLEHTTSDGRGEWRTKPGGRSIAGGCGDSFWSDSILIPCRDGKARRLKPGIEPLVDGIPGRVGLLRGYGNAIVPQVAAAFIRAFLETESGVMP